MHTQLSIQSVTRSVDQKVVLDNHSKKTSNRNNKTQQLTANLQANSEKNCQEKDRLSRERFKRKYHKITGSVPVNPSKNLSKGEGCQQKGWELIKRQKLTELKKEEELCLTDGFSLEDLKKLRLLLDRTQAVIEHGVLGRLDKIEEILEIETQY